jgi:mono/diheme cytochrome c family protein
MKTLAVLVLLALSAGTLTSAGTLKPNANGKAIFDQFKCAKCHTIESQGIKLGGPAPEGKTPPDLSKAGAKHDANWISKWLLKEEELNGKKHVKRFTGSDDELKTLSTWLAGLKK